MVRRLLVKGLKSGVKKAMQAGGYRWELRRQGDVALGLWRKQLNPKRAQLEDARRIVIIPGFGDSALSWLPVWTALLPVLRRRFDEIVFLDFPGFGGWLSEARAFDSMDRLIDAVSDVLDDLRPQTLFGHSLGGWLSGHYLSDTARKIRPKHPVRMGVTYTGPKQTILACPAGVFESEHARKIWEEKFRGVQRDGFGAFRSELFSKEPSWFRLMVPEFARFFARQEIHEFMDSFGDHHLLTPELGRSTGEVWLLFTDLDGIAPVTAIPAWRELLGASEAGSVVIRNCGHSPHIEKFTVLLVVLGQIVSGKSPSPQGDAWYRVTLPNGSRDKSASPSAKE